MSSLPFELLAQIFHHVSPEENLLSLQLVSQYFRTIASEPLLWRFYCLSSFRHWAPEHEIEAKYDRPDPTSVPWQDLWLRRKRTNARISNQLGAIIESATHRLARIGEVCEFGYDAKDYLLEQSRAPEGLEDVLARRYWARTILASIHRGMAVDAWANMSSTRDGLDRGLSAFDMFVLHDQEYDMDWVSRHLDGLTEEFRKEHPAFDEWSTRRQALALVRWMRTTKGFNGVPGPEEVNYRNLRNCLIGHALTEEDHASLPIISSAIYQQIATRLGLQAELCSYPSHIYVSVQPPPNRDLDGEPLTDAARQQRRMYLDPFKHEHEVSEASLRRFLADHGLQSGMDVFLEGARPEELLIRVAHNIKATHDESQVVRPPDDPSQPFLKRLRAGYDDLNLEAAYYGSLWAMLVLTPVSRAGWDHNLAYSLRRFALAYSEDLWIVKRYLSPLYDQLPHQDHRFGWDNLNEVLGMLHNLDNRRSENNRRYTEDIQARVRYKVGQVFRHKRYNYIGVINGWTTGGSGPLPSSTYMQVGEEDHSIGPDSPNPRRRTFYSAL